MNKIAAYKVALTLSQIEKEAGVADAVGKGVTGGIYRLGKFLGGSGRSGAREGLGGKLMDFGSRMGGNVRSGATKASLKAQKAATPGLTTKQFKANRDMNQKIVGGVALGGGALGAGAVGAALS
jgi:hypothetical protein